MILRAKSKTFLAGEYCVTCGGSAIVLCTPPSFLLEIRKCTESTIRGVRESSPAFAFYRRNFEIFKNLFIKFLDPHHRAGGFGASSAQFAMLYRLKEKLEKISIRNYLSEEYTGQFLKEYHSITKRMNDRSCMRKLDDKNTVTPSGADCLAQLHNCNIYFNSSTNVVERIGDWPFKDIDFIIVRTGQKVPTYRHLCQLSADLIKPYEYDMSRVVEEIKTAWQFANSKHFVRGIEKFSEILLDLDLITPETKEILRWVRNINGVMVAKGCGAMGADTVLIVLEEIAKEAAIKEIEENLVNG